MARYAVTAVALLAARALAQGNLPTVSTPPSLTVCQPARLDLAGGVAPYTVDAIPAEQVSAAPLTSIGTNLPAGATTWVVNLPAGTAISLQIRDSTGALNYGSALTILPGGDTSCVGQDAAAAPVAGASAGSSASTTASSAASVSSSGAAATSSSAGAVTPSAAPSASSAAGPVLPSSPAARPPTPNSVAPASSSAPPRSSGAASRAQTGSYALALAGVVAAIAA